MARFVAPLFLVAAVLVHGASLHGAAAVSSEHGAPPPALSLYYTDQSPDDNHFPPHMWVVRARFTGAGTLLSRENVTKPELGLGYLSLSPNGSTLLLASETPSMEDDVQTYALDLAAAGAGALPRLLFADAASQATLLAPCAPRCVAVSTFHGYFAPDGRIFFAFTLWDADGNGVGSQALAVADASGANVRVLTWVADENIFDECPTPVADPARVVFTRTSNQGVSTFLALADTRNGSVTLLDTLPAVAVSSGCPASLPDGSILYMSCSLPDCGEPMRASVAQFAQRRRSRSSGQSGARRWGAQRLGTRPRAAAAVAPVLPARPVAGNMFAYETLALPAGMPPARLNSTFLWPVPLTNTPSTIDSYAITQCDIIRGSRRVNPISCQGSDPTREFFMRLIVNQADGATVAESNNTFLYCMTPRCTLTALA